MKPILNIIVLNIYMRLLFNGPTSPAKIREPLITNWQTIFEKTTNLSFRDETTKMLQKLQKINTENSSILYDSSTELWCINDYTSLEKRFISIILTDLKRNFNDNFHLGEYELTDMLYALICEEFKDAFEEEDINLYALTE